MLSLTQKNPPVKIDEIDDIGKNQNKSINETSASSISADFIDTIDIKQIRFTEFYRLID